MPTPNGESAAIGGAQQAPVSVSQLLRSVRDTLEHRFPLMWVAGEISNFTRAASGHWYFTLKDDDAQVDCVMFRGRAAYLDWTPKEGARVEARVLVTLYEPRGRFQLNVETMRHAGLGPLFERFLRLKEQLAREGLFDVAAKREPPAHPRAVGVLTSLARRNPSLPVIVYPVPVQGDGAAERIAAMLRTANARAECDVLLLVRGGGSLEDLWQFNEQAVARAIRASRIPVVVGVGHETDFTIADFAADRRAPTPTAAAELVSAPRAELIARVAELALRAGRESLRRIGYAMQTVDGLARRLVHPAERINASRQLVGQLAARLASANARQLDAVAARLERLRTGLAGLDPSAVLARGYSITRNGAGEVLRDAARVAEGERLVTTLSKGWIESEARRKGS
jgi:exodeoxyribonuclease VII large subunit